MAETFRFSSYMIDPGTNKVALKPLVPQPKPAPVAVAFSPPEPESGPPYTLIAAGVVALGVVGLVVWKLRRKKKR